MLIDTHVHLDAAEFDGDREALISQARAAGVAGFVVPAVAAANFAAVRALAGARTDTSVLRDRTAQRTIDCRAHGLEVEQASPFAGRSDGAVVAQQVNNRLCWDTACVACSIQLLQVRLREPKHVERR